MVGVSDCLQEKRTLPGATADVLGFRYVAVDVKAHECTDTISAFRFGNINPIPFRLMEDTLKTNPPF